MILESIVRFFFWIHSNKSSINFLIHLSALSIHLTVFLVHLSETSINNSQTAAMISHTKPLRVMSISQPKITQFISINLFELSAQPRNLSSFNSNGLSLKRLSFSTISAEFESIEVWLHELLINTPTCLLCLGYVSRKVFVVFLTTTFRAITNFFFISKV